MQTFDLWSQGRGSSHLDSAPPSPQGSAWFEQTPHSLSSLPSALSFLVLHLGLLQYPQQLLTLLKDIHFHSMRPQLDLDNCISSDIEGKKAFEMISVKTF